jgi:hypothetical protein
MQCSIPLTELIGGVQRYYALHGLGIVQGISCMGFMQGLLHGSWAVQGVFLHGLHAMQGSCAAYIQRGNLEP